MFSRYSTLAAAIALTVGAAAAFADARQDCTQREDADRRLQGCSQVLQADPRAGWAWVNRCAANRDKGFKSKADDAALADCDRAIELSPTSAAAYNGRAWVYYRKIDYNARAIADNTKALQLDPSYFDAYVDRGKVHVSNRSYDLAIADFSKAIELKPSVAQTYNDRGYPYRARGAYDRAIADFTKAIELDAKFVFAYRNRGEVYAEKGDYDRAIADYDKALQIDSNHGPAYSYRGDALVAKGDYAAAIADYTKAISRYPFASDYRRRAWAYFKVGRLNEALADSDKGIEGLHINDGEALDVRAHILEALGRRDEAIALFRRAVTLSLHNQRQRSMDALKRLGAAR
jgi:tetratricopeptide (TPR) repeat protein